MTPTQSNQPEPWLRGTLTDLDAVRRQVVHALELAVEDVDRWCTRLSDEQINLRPAGLAPVAFHLRHIARSLDRLLTYAEGRPLSAAQQAALESELDPGARTADVLSEFHAAIEQVRQRIQAFDRTAYEQPRGVGRKHLPSSVGGLLIHCAEHTQRHIGQAITTARIVAATTNS
jgi:uncharacterized damage-inducible protein DinB